MTFMLPTEYGNRTVGIESPLFNHTNYLIIATPATSITVLASARSIILTMVV